MVQGGLFPWMAHTCSLERHSQTSSRGEDFFPLLLLQSRCGGRWRWVGPPLLESHIGKSKTEQAPRWAVLRKASVWLTWPSGGQYWWPWSSTPSSRGQGSMSGQSQTLRAQGGTHRATASLLQAPRRTSRATVSVRRWDSPVPSGAWGERMKQRSRRRRRNL